jgi:preprotein translocase subunit YajC
MRIIPPEIKIKLVLTTVAIATFAIITPILTAQIASAQEIETELQPDALEASPSATTSATPSASPSQTTTVTNLETREVSGEVIRTENDRITVETDAGETVEMQLFDNIQITRDGKDVQPSDIKTGDQVTATIDSNSNQAIVLEATSQQTDAMQQWLVPAIIGGLILLGLIYWLMRKAQRQRIKTTTTNM